MEDTKLADLAIPRTKTSRQRRCNRAGETARVPMHAPVTPRVE